jgi:hypothetical protein
MKEIDEELKVGLIDARVKTDICIDEEKKRYLLTNLSDSKKYSEQRLKITDRPAVIEALKYNIKMINYLRSDIEKIDTC